MTLPSSSSLQTTVAFCVYNRLEPAREVFRTIAKQRPERLLVIGDGPNRNRAGDREAVQATRDVIKVDWPCDFQTCYSDTNLGCRKRMATGITWAFEQAEELIILEDDCLPDDSFFSFCSELLERYRNEPQIMSISGSNFQPSRCTSDSYYFSRWTHIWGWASWRRAWDHYDVEMQDWPQTRDSGLLGNVVEQEGESEIWNHVFNNQHAGNIDTWDFPWLYACWMNGGRTVLPAKNLVTNIGFGDDATHTVDSASPLANQPRFSAFEDDGKLRHPLNIARDQVADDWTYRNMFAHLKPDLKTGCSGLKPWWKKLLRRKSRIAA